MRRRTLIAQIVAASALVAVPGQASAGFVADVIRVSADADDSVFPIAAADASGRTLVVWQERIEGQRHVVARRVGPDGGMGARIVVSDGTMIPVQRAVTTTPGGRALIVWTESALGTQPRFLRARWVEPDDTMGPQVTLRNAGMVASAESPAVTATTLGDAVVAWRNSASAPANQVESRLLGAGGQLGSLLQPPEGPGSGGVRIARTSAGGALVVWGGPPAVRAMAVSAAGSAGAVQTPVAAGIGGSATPDLSSDGQDRFRIVWTPTGEPDTAASVALDVTGAAAGSRLSLDTEGAPGSFPSVATGADGRSLALWSRTGAVAAARLIGADGLPAGGIVTAPSADQQFPIGAGVLSDGTGVALWSQGPPGQPRPLWARVVTPAASFEAPVQLAGGSASTASVVPTGPGAGLVVWDQRDAGSSGPHVVAARRYLPVPTCAPAAATAVQGRPVDIALSCSGPELTGVEIVTQPSPGALQALGPTAFRYLPRAGFDGTDRFTFRPVGAGGSGAVADAVVTVGRDTVPPLVRAFSLSRRTIPLATAFRARPSRRPAFRVRLGEPATIAIVVQRRVGRRWRGVGVLRRRSEVTTARIPLGRRVGTRVLRPGRHRARLLATDSVGNRAPIRTVTFRVTRR